MSRHIKVLIVEDSEDDTLLLLRELKKGGFEPEYERVDNAREMTISLDAKTWDLVISDYSMPSFTGLDALHMLKEKDIDIPFIIVSGKIGEDTAVETMKAGANDYIMKGNYSRLVPAVERELRESGLRKEGAKAETALKNKMKELEDFYEMAVGRELKMVELKEEIEKLKAQLVKDRNP